MLLTNIDIPLSNACDTLAGSTLAMRFALVVIPLVLSSAPPDGAALYKEKCATCHDGPRQERMPRRAEIAGRTPESVLESMVKGTMKPQSEGLTDDDKRAIARYVTGKEFGGAAVAPVEGACTKPAPRFELRDTDWNGWGRDVGGSRFQPKPGLKPEDVPKLKLKWAFGFPGAGVSYAQPTVAGGRVFIGSVMGNVYSLDAATGCIYWTYTSGAAVRSAITIGRLPSGGWAAYFADFYANVHAVDVGTGKQLWKVKVDDHPTARGTGSPVFHNGRLYVPVSSHEEPAAMSPAYQCCTFRGSVVALDGASGKQIWKSYTVLEEPKPTKKSANGTQLFGPAGAAIWSSPTIDEKRGLVYAATGNSYTDVDIETSDAILAFDLKTGKLAWSSQVTAKDNFVMGKVNLPEKPGPDYDFGSSPILRTLSNGKQIIVAAQKSGIVYGMDPDNKGKILWQTKLGEGGALGGVEWGHAADDQHAYAGVVDRFRAPGGLYAVQLATGEKVWSAMTELLPGCNVRTSKCLRSISAAISAIPGIVFAGSLDGHFRAFNSKTGEIVWDFETAVPFETVNKVTAKGGSFDAAGPTIANGMVFTGSGYGQWGGMAGNVLLAFSVDGK